jgi:hypothetical protein
MHHICQLMPRSTKDLQGPGPGPSHRVVTFFLSSADVVLAPLAEIILSSLTASGCGGEVVFHDPSRIAISSSLR